MSEEKTYLKGDDFEVTSSKVVVGSTTYALRNIAGTSVNQTNFGWKIAGWMCIVFGVLPLLVGFFTFTVVFALIMVGCGLYLLTIKEKWYVVISSGGKESGFLHHVDKKPVEDVVEAINQALLDLDKYSREAQAASKQDNSDVSSADELIKLKGLLDDGVITQEDFDAKKKEILGL
tara:strand:+ start:10933 stop:11460 length:528 start_codon:yes stop_codon:yes gene_type:complete